MKLKGREKKGNSRDGFTLSSAGQVGERRRILGAVDYLFVTLINTQIYEKSQMHF